MSSTASVISGISVTKVGTSVRNKKSIYTATEVTRTGDPAVYTTKIIRYSDAKGNNPVTIGTRDSQTGKINFTTAASTTEQQYSATLGKTSTGQISSVAGSITSNASEKASLNAIAGKSNQALGSGVSNQPQGGRRGQGGRPLGDTTRRGGEGDGGASVSGAGGAVAVAGTGVGAGARAPYFD